MLGRGTLAKAAPKQSVLSSAVLWRRRCHPRQKHNCSLVSRRPSRGGQRSFSTAEQTHCEAGSPPRDREDTVYINLAGC